MKIAICFYQINNLGGIINHTEDLIGGLKDFGCSVELISLHYQDKFISKRKSFKELKEEDPVWNIKDSGIPVHQRKGWYLEPWKSKFSYKGKENIKKTKEKLSQFDLIIWTVPVPTKQKQNRGNTDWLPLYDIPVKQIAVIHDGNFNTSYPWLYEVKDYISGLACVHQAAYQTASLIDIPRAFILNPQKLDDHVETFNYFERENGFLSLQTFKALKKVDDIIRAIPYMKEDTKKYIAGGGASHYYYMISDNKCKPEYYCRKKEDPNLPDHIEEQKIKIWDRALEYGFEWLGYIDANRRDEILKSVKTLIDSSWSKGYSKNGGHFNRTIIEAAIQGAIPIARNLGMSGNEEGTSLLFNPNENYIMIPWNTTPKEFAELTEEAQNLDKNLVIKILENNYKLIKGFERKKIAQDFLNLAEGKPCGYFNNIEVGKKSRELAFKSSVAMNEFFYNDGGN